VQSYEPHATSPAPEIDRHTMLPWFRTLIWPAISGVLLGLLILAWWPDPAEPTGATLSFAPAVARAAPAVVNIHTSKRLRSPDALAADPLVDRLLERGSSEQQARVQRSLGSGVIVDRRGYVLTNHHVIRGADQIVVRLPDGREATARAVGVDPDTDLAALKIDLPDLEPIAIGDPARARVGDLVLAIGNPYGFGQSVSQGIISATGRYGLQLATYENYIQTDAAINPGNSGGALIDLQGRLLGINAAIFTPSGASSGIGLAVPADLALRTMADLIAYGRPVRGWLGIEVEPLTGTFDRTTTGVMITTVYDDGPGMRGGLRSGDVITAINGMSVGDGHAGLNLLGSTRPGDRVQLEVWRDGARRSLEITVGMRPAVTAGTE
jgi:serine protease DegS